MPPGSRSWNVVVVIVAASIGSLNDTLAFDAGATPWASGAGSCPVTVGGVVSGPVSVSKTTSTQ